MFYVLWLLIVRSFKINCSIIAPLNKMKLLSNYKIDWLRLNKCFIKHNNRMKIYRMRIISSISNSSEGIKHLLNLIHWGSLGKWICVHVIYLEKYLHPWVVRATKIRQNPLLVETIEKLPSLRWQTNLHLLNSIFEWRTSHCRSRASVKGWAGLIASPKHLRLRPQHRTLYERTKSYFLLERLK